MEMSDTIELLGSQTDPASSAVFGSGSRIPAVLISLGALSSHAASVERSRPTIVVKYDPIQSTDAHESEHFKYLTNTSWVAASEALRAFDVHNVWMRISNSPLEKHSFRDAAGILDEITSAFGLSMTQLADVARTSRQTVYGWRRGQQLRSAARERLDRLVVLAQHWGNISAAPVGEALEHRDSTTGKSLLDLLSSEPLAEKEIISHLDRLNEYIRASWSASDADSSQLRARRQVAISEEWREHTLRSFAGRRRRM